METAKWNTGHSVAIEKLTEAELKEAVKEWAEGCEPLERLLWACRENGVATLGSCADECYVQIDIEGSSKESLKKLFSAAMVFGHGDIFLAYFGNPFSGPNWWKPNIAFSVMNEREAFEELCDTLTEALNDTTVSDKHASVYESFMSLYSTFAKTGRNVDLRIWMKSRTSYNYKFAVSFRHEEEYLLKMFEEAGLKSEFRNEWKCHCVFETQEHSEFANKMKEISEFVSKECKLEVPMEISDNMTFAEKAIVMRNFFGTDRIGVEKMNDWLNKNKWRPDQADVNY